MYLSWCSHHLNDTKKKTWCKNEHLRNLMDKVVDSRGNLKLWQKLITVDGFSAMCPAVYLFCLTLRRLMSYIYIYIYIYMEHPFLMFLNHTQRRSTVGRTPLDE